MSHAEASAYRRAAGDVQLRRHAVHGVRIVSIKCGAYIVGLLAGCRRWLMLALCISMVSKDELSSPTGEKEIYLTF